MTKDEARIVLLEDALEQAQSTVSFLHSCLTESKFKYAYPEHTLRDLEEWAALVPPREYCIHSRHLPDCESCQAHIAKMNRMAEAYDVLGQTPKWGKSVSSRRRSDV